MERAKEKAHQQVRAKTGIQISQSESVKDAAGAGNKKPSKNFYAARHKKPCSMERTAIEHNPHNCRTKIQIFFGLLEKCREYADNHSRQQRRNQCLRHAASRGRPEWLAIFERLLTGDEKGSDNRDHRRAQPEKIKSASRIEMTCQTDDCGDHAERASQEHDGCQRAPVERRTFHQSSNGLQVFFSPIVFHVITLHHKVTFGKRKIAVRIIRAIF